MWTSCSRRIPGGAGGELGTTSQKTLKKQRARHTTKKGDRARAARRAKAARGPSASGTRSQAREIAVASVGFEGGDAIGRALTAEDWFTSPYPVVLAARLRQEAVQRRKKEGRAGTEEQVPGDTGRLRASSRSRTTRGTGGIPLLLADRTQPARTI